MASNLECIGLAAADEASLSALVRDAVASAAPVGEIGGTTVLRYDDPSGARLMLGVAGGEIVDLLPSFAGDPGCTAGTVDMLTDEVSSVEFVDSDGEVLTVGAVEVEQRAWLRVGLQPPVPCAFGLVALGVGMTVHADTQAYETSPHSLLVPQDATRERPADLHESVRWPMRFAAESFVSHGLFNSDAGAHAWLSGVVVEATSPVTALTNQAFTHVRVRSVMGEIDVCLPELAGVPQPRPGAVVAGDAFIVGTLAGWSVSQGTATA